MQLRNKERGELSAKHTKFNDIAVTGKSLSLTMGNKKTTLFIRLSMYLAQRYQFGAQFLCLELETGPPFYVAIQNMQR